LWHKFFCFTSKTSFSKYEAIKTIKNKRRNKDIVKQNLNTLSALSVCAIQGRKEEKKLLQHCIVANE